MNKIKHFMGNKNTVKNSTTSEVNLPQNLDLLNKWTIPKVSIKNIYQLGTFEKLGFIQVVKTTEESVSLNNEEMILKLINKHDLTPYINGLYKFLHIGLVQVAFRPLTLEGLPESFIASLRDGRNLNWKKSIIGVIKSSLAHGPVYFDVYPNLNLSLTDDNILDALTLNVKTHGYNYAPGSEVICICYRIYYKPLHTLNPCCKMIDKAINETTVIETNFNKSEITTRRKIKWEEIDFPENWKIERAITPKPIIYTDLLEVMDVTEAEDGSVNINFDNRSKSNRLQRSYTSRSSFGSGRSFISPLDYITEQPSTSRHSTSHIRENIPDYNPESRIDEFKIHNDNIIKGHSKKNVETMSQMSYDFNG